ncbi:MAG: ATP-binding protein, partial [Bacteroidota bacterium]
YNANKGLGNVPEEFTIINKQGEEVIVEKTAYPMMFHGETSVLGIVRDITQRKIAEKKLRQSEEKFKALVNSTDDIIILIDKDYVHRGMYGRGMKKLGLDPKDYIGKKISEVFDQETTEIHIKALEKVFRGEFEVFTWRYTLPDGEIFLQTSLSPIYNENGEIDSVVGIARDLTDTHELLKELEEAKEKAEESNRLKSAFLANISHEIRTPMNGIMGFTELLKSPELPRDKINEFVEIIDSQSQHLLQIINDIIDVSKMEADQFTLKKKETPVNELLQKQYDIYYNLLHNRGNKNITLKLELPDQEHVVYTDDTRLAQVVSNLLDNAVKFTEKGSIHFGYQKNDPEHLIFYVKDTGIGIPEDKQDVIFKSFRRVNESMTRTFEGAGLGLAITNKLVEKLGGEICLKSEEGKGSSFYFTLPYQTKKYNSPSGEKSDKNKALDLCGKTIMVVEDDEPSRLYLEEMLKPTHAKVITAENGDVAWKKILKDHSISMILMDIKLPDHNGLELTGEIKKRYPDIPVIAQTAYAMNKDTLKALKKGCDDYISKPIEQRRLSELINKYLKSSD